VFEYLQKALDLPVEFFQALHCFFLDDVTEFVSEMSKSFRRLIFLEDQRGGNGAATFANKRALGGSGGGTAAEQAASASVPPPKIAEQFIELMNHRAFNSSFFAKEL
jgi:hypothetical protein